MCTADVLWTVVANGLHTDDGLFKLLVRKLLYNWFMSAVCFSSSTEVMVKVHVVDLKNETIATPVSVRAYLNQTITEFKQLISQVTHSLS